MFASVQSARFVQLLWWSRPLSRRERERFLESCKIIDLLWWCMIFWAILILAEALILLPDFENPSKVGLILRSKIWRSRRTVASCLTIFSSPSNWRFHFAVERVSAPTEEREGEEEEEDDSLAAASLLLDNSSSSLSLCATWSIKPVSRRNPSQLVSQSHESGGNQINLCEKSKYRRHKEKVNL